MGSSSLFLPSEIARLVVGYLESSNYVRTKETFLSGCEELQEIHRLMQKGVLRSFDLGGLSLVDILDEYSMMKEEIDRLVPAFEAQHFKSDGPLRKLKLIGEKLKMIKNTPHPSSSKQLHEDKDPPRFVNLKNNKSYSLKHGGGRVRTLLNEKAREERRAAIIASANSGAENVNASKQQRLSNQLQSQKSEVEFSSLFKSRKSVMKQKAPIKNRKLNVINGDTYCTLRQKMGTLIQDESNLDIVNDLVAEPIAKILNEQSSAGGNIMGDDLLENSDILNNLLQALDTVEPSFSKVPQLTVDTTSVSTPQHSPGTAEPSMCKQNPKSSEICQSMPNLFSAGKDNSSLIDKTVEKTSIQETPVVTEAYKPRRNRLSVDNPQKLFDKTTTQTSQGAFQNTVAVDAFRFVRSQPGPPIEKSQKAGDKASNHNSQGTEANILATSELCPTIENHQKTVENASDRTPQGSLQTPIARQAYKSIKSSSSVENPQETVDKASNQNPQGALQTPIPKDTRREPGPLLENPQKTDAKTSNQNFQVTLQTPIVENYVTISSGPSIETHQKPVQKASNKNSQGLTKTLVVSELYKPVRNELNSAPENPSKSSRKPRFSNSPGLSQTPVVTRLSRLDVPSDEPPKTAEKSLLLNCQESLETPVVSSIIYNSLKASQPIYVTLPVKENNENVISDTLSKAIQDTIAVTPNKIYFDLPVVSEIPPGAIAISPTLRRETVIKKRALDFSRCAEEELPAKKSRSELRLESNVVQFQTALKGVLRPYTEKENITVDFSQVPRSANGDGRSHTLHTLEDAVRCITQAQEVLYVLEEPAEVQSKSQTSELAKSPLKMTVDVTPKKQKSSSSSPNNKRVLSPVKGSPLMTAILMTPNKILAATPKKSTGALAAVPVTPGKSNEKLQHVVVLKTPSKDFLESFKPSSKADGSNHLKGTQTYVKIATPGKHEFIPLTPGKFKGSVLLTPCKMTTTPRKPVQTPLRQEEALNTPAKVSPEEQKAFTPSLLARKSVETPPSSSTQREEQDTPGLKFLNQEIERFSCSDASASEDSMSPFKFQKKAQNQLRHKLVQKQRKEVGLAIESTLATKLKSPPSKVARKNIAELFESTNLPDPEVERVAEAEDDSNSNGSSSSDSSSCSSFVSDSSNSSANSNSNLPDEDVEKKLEIIKASIPRTPLPPPRRKPTQFNSLPQRKPKRAVLQRVECRSPLRNPFQSNWEFSHDVNNLDLYTSRGDNDNVESCDKIEPLLNDVSKTPPEKNEVSKEKSPFKIPSPMKQLTTKSQEKVIEKDESLPSKMSSDQDKGRSGNDKSDSPTVETVISIFIPEKDKTFKVPSPVKQSRITSKEKKACDTASQEKVGNAGSSRADSDKDITDIKTSLPKKRLLEKPIEATKGANQSEVQEAVSNDHSRSLEISESQKEIKKSGDSKALSSKKRREESVHETNEHTSQETSKTVGESESSSLNVVCATSESVTKISSRTLQESDPGFDAPQKQNENEGSQLQSTNTAEMIELSYKNQPQPTVEKATKSSQKAKTSTPPLHDKSKAVPINKSQKHTMKSSDSTSSSKAESEGLKKAKLGKSYRQTASGADIPEKSISSQVEELEIQAPLEKFRKMPTPKGCDEDKPPPHRGEPAKKKPEERSRSPQLPVPDVKEKPKPLKENANKGVEEAVKASTDSDGHNKTCRVDETTTTGSEDHKKLFPDESKGKVNPEMSDVNEAQMPRISKEDVLRSEKFLRVVSELPKNIEIKRIVKKSSPKREGKISKKTSPKKNKVVKHVSVSLPKKSKDSKHEETDKGTNSLNSIKKCAEKSRKLIPEVKNSDANLIREPSNEKAKNDDDLPSTLPLVAVPSPSATKSSPFSKVKKSLNLTMSNLFVFFDQVPFNDN